MSARGDALHSECPNFPFFPEYISSPPSRHRIESEAVNLKTSIILLENVNFVEIHRDEKCVPVLSCRGRIAA